MIIIIIITIIIRIILYDIILHYIILYYIILLPAPHYLLHNCSIIILQYNVTCAILYCMTLTNDIIVCAYMCIYKSSDACYARFSNEDPAKSGLESRRILNAEGGFFLSAPLNFLVQRFQNLD